jgi:hypothetical protein
MLCCLVHFIHCLCWDALGHVDAILLHDLCTLRTISSKGSQGFNESNNIMPCATTYLVLVHIKETLLLQLQCRCTCQDIAVAA